MICISIAQSSRRFALVDMLNAAREGDLLEVRLDCFGKAPELGELMARKSRPVIMTCRRPQDGGLWEGTEQERLAILRQCIVSKADYVEIELDVADEIRPFPPSKRVISYTNLKETPEDILDIYRQAQSKNPDVVKLTTLARTPEEAWPLLQIVATASVPTVAVGLGRPGLTLALLGKKIGAPWAYAALERGMEAFPGQPTLYDLEEVYRYRDIDRGTRLVGVTGFGERAYLSTAILNGLFRHFNLPARVLPVGLGDPRLFRRIAGAVKMAGILVDPDHQATLLQAAAEAEPAATLASAANLLLFKNDRWHAYNTFIRAALATIDGLLRARGGTEAGLKNCVTALVGLNTVTRALGQAIAARGGALIIASHDKEGAQALAQELGCRYVVFEGVYTTLHDVLVVCDDERAQRGSAGPSVVHPGYLKPGMTVMDLTAATGPTPLLVAAKARGCAVASPRRLLLDQLALQAHLLTSKDVTAELLEQVTPAPLREEEGEKTMTNDQ
jgi:3-dehydroquinate dehydratase/shikimate dehydrogenase